MSKEDKILKEIAEIKKLVKGLYSQKRSKKVDEPKVVNISADLTDDKFEFKIIDDKKELM